MPAADAFQGSHQRPHQRAIRCLLLGEQVDGAHLQLWGAVYGEGRGPPQMFSRYSRRQIFRLFEDLRKVIAHFRTKGNEGGISPRQPGLARHRGGGGVVVEDDRTPALFPVAQKKYVAAADVHEAPRGLHVEVVLPPWEVNHPATARRGRIHRPLNGVDIVQPIVRDRPEVGNPEAGQVQLPQVFRFLPVTIAGVGEIDERTGRRIRQPLP